MSIRNVALLGADGKIGPAILEALISHGFKVTVLKRESSKSNKPYPDGVKTVRVEDDFSVNAVAKQLHGIDAMVVTIKGTQTDLQFKLAEACVQAGVKRFIPADFGSCDSSSSKTQQLVPLYVHKSNLRKKLSQLAEGSDAFSWTSLVCGHFFDWSLEFLHLDVEGRKADILDNGEVKWSASTLSRIAEATARILENLEPTRNKMIYVQSVCVSQNEVIEAYERATGSHWEVTKYDSEEFEREEKLKADAGNSDANENLVWLLGTLDANWEPKENFAMEMLGLENEDLDEIVKRVVNDQS